MAQVGIMGNIQEVYGSQVYANWFALGPEARNLKTGWGYDDFLYTLYTTGSIVGPWYCYYNGAGASIAALVGSQTRPGQVNLQTGTTAAGTAYLLNGGAGANCSFIFGAGVYIFETEIYLPALSTAIEEYNMRVGFGDSGGVDHTDGAYFEYDRAATGTNWRCKTANNSARTDEDSGVAVVAGSWIRLKIVVNADGTNVDYYINGTLVSDITTNIPTARDTAVMFVFTKTVGLTSRSLYIDWSWLHYDLAASR